MPEQLHHDSDTAQVASRRLTARQRGFVEQYALDRNGTQTAIRAGYAPHTARVQASRLLTNAAIRAAVDAALARLAAKTDTAPSGSDAG